MLVSIKKAMEERENVGAVAGNWTATESPRP